MKVVVDRLCQQAQLEQPAGLPASTPPVVVYRCIATFLAPAAFGRARWECRNGYCSTSGYGDGVRDEWFNAFPSARERLRVRHRDDTRGEPAFRFWFLLQDGKPKLCLESTGRSWDLSGRKHNVYALYHRHNRIWPIVWMVAGHLFA
jgi:hypothetical protein